MIKIIANTINSKRDTSGNCYFAMRITDPINAKTVYGMISGNESNVYAAVKHLGLEADQIFSYSTELPKREFRSLTADWEYAGCAPDDLAAWIVEQLSKRDPVTVAQLPDLIGTNESRPMLYCETCGAEYSASKGDYFQESPDHVFECCDQPMRLVIKRTVFEDYK